MGMVSVQSYILRRLHDEGNFARRYLPKGFVNFDVGNRRLAGMVFDSLIKEMILKHFYPTKGLLFKHGYLDYIYKTNFSINKLHEHEVILRDLINRELREPLNNFFNSLNSAPIVSAVFDIVFPNEQLAFPIEIDGAIMDKRDVKGLIEIKLFNRYSAAVSMAVLHHFMILPNTVVFMAKYNGKLSESKKYVTTDKLETFIAITLNGVDDISKAVTSLSPHVDKYWDETKNRYYLIMREYYDKIQKHIKGEDKAKLKEVQWGNNTF